MRSLSGENVPVSCPGEKMAAELRTRGWTQKELALRSGETARSIAAIIRGKKRINAKLALKFERVFGVSAGTWLSLENDYRLRLAIKAAEGSNNDISTM